MSPDDRIRAPEVSHLLDQLREARARSGLSFAALGARTDYSKSSWERYLNGKALPPRQAVAALARLADMPPTRLLALWELADRAWSGRDGHPSTPPRGTPTTAERAADVAGAGRDAAERAADVAGAGRAASVAVLPPGVPKAPDAANPADAPDPFGASGDASAGAPGGAGTPGPRRGAGRRWRAWAEWGAAGAALGLMVAVAVWVTGNGGEHGEDPVADQEPTAASGPCHGASCTGRDSDNGETGCWMDAATHATREVRGRVAELRVSGSCSAAWARLVEPRAGDELWIEAGELRQSVRATATNRYLLTLMVGIDRPTEARVCYTLADGTSGCTTWGSESALPR